MTIVICGECDDAPAVTKRWFNGVTLTDLCQPCADFWDNHALTEPAPSDANAPDQSRALGAPAEPGTFA